MIEKVVLFLAYLLIALPSRAIVATVGAVQFVRLVVRGELFTGVPVTM